MTLPLVFSLVLVGFATVSRILSGTWLHPSALFPLWWCFAGIVPMIVMPSEPVSTGAIAWVIVASLAVSLGGWVGSGGVKTRRIAVPVESGRLERQLLSTTLVVSLILGIASSVVFAIKSGVSAADLVDIQRYVVVSQQLYAARYVESGIAPAPPLASQALLPFVYIAPIVGGLVFVQIRNWQWKVVALLSLLPAIIVTALQTTKAAILFSASFWLASYFAARLRSGQVRVFTRGHITAAVILGGLTTLFFFSVSFARLKSTDLALLNLVLVKLATSAFGHMTVFSAWLTQYWNEPFRPTLGSYTFSGPLELLGFGRRIPGIFENLIELVAGEQSNIFTGFRPLIEDFTIPGALAILAMLGVITGYAFRSVATGYWGWAPVLIAGYITILWTPITWFWIYNSLTATVIGLAALIWFIRMWRRRALSAGGSATPHVSSA